MPPGCSFAPRCPSVIPGRCDLPPGPALLPWRDGRVRCLRAGELGRFDPAPAASPPPPRRAGVERLALVDVEKRFERRGLFGARLARRRRAVVKAVDRVSFDLREGEIVALVGESGSGKSTIAKLLVGLDTADAGSIGLDGAEIATVPARARQAAQRRAVQIVFQNPDATLNPARTVGHTLRRAVGRLTGLSGRDAQARVAALLEMVRLPPEAARRLPEALSGGQRQRVAIARAMAGAPEVLVADEPVSALDVSVQAAIVNLLADLQENSGTAILLISHDLGLVRHVADRVVVMYRGRVMIQGPTEEVFSPPLHPYVETLLAAAPRLDDLDQLAKRRSGAGFDA
jgi:peptide/nickel transport system ATP-binding protein